MRLNRQEAEGDDAGDTTVHIVCLGFVEPFQKQRGQAMSAKKMGERALATSDETKMMSSTEGQVIRLVAAKKDSEKRWSDEI